MLGGGVSPWRRRHPGVSSVNHCGPTEVTVGCVDYRIMADNVIPSGPVPIGRPMANMRVYVLDAGLQPVPPGVDGELYIAGAGLVRGYLRRPGVTAGRRVADPLGVPGSRLYGSGGLGWWGPGGDLVFAGQAG